MNSTEFQTELERVGVAKKHAKQAFAWIRQNGEQGVYDIWYYEQKPPENGTWVVNDNDNIFRNRETGRLIYMFALYDKGELDEEPPFNEMRRSDYVINLEHNNIAQIFDALEIEYYGIGHNSEDENDEESEEIMTSEQHLNLLRQFYQIIFYGPPGTGKTYAAKGILRKLLGDNFAKLQNKRWDIVQFHPSYNYEDFVRGVQVKTENGQVAYETLNRTFGEMCERANEDSKNDYVLIIDEINRANVSAVLGELIYALEYRDEKVKTPYLGDIVIPSNLYIIGTMNTADRTIGQIDYAVRRRFAFLHCPPDETIIEDETAYEFFADVDEIFHNHISQDFDAADVRIGHSYFLPKDKNGFVDNELANKILYQVVPILWEYFKDGVLTNSESAKKAIEEIEEKAKKLLADESEESDSSVELITERGNKVFFWQRDNRFGINGISRTVLSITKDYVHHVSPHLLQDIEKLQEWFPDSRQGKNYGIKLLREIQNNHGYRNHFCAQPEESLHLNNGDEVLITSQWNNAENNQDWVNFANKMNQEGYSIRGCHFVNVGSFIKKNENNKSTRRGWKECKKFGFLAAGGVHEKGHGTYADGLKKLQPKEMVFAHLTINETHKGYIAYGKVIEEAVPIRDFMVNGIPLLECITDDGSPYKDKYPTAQETADDIKDCDWILKVNWIKVLSDDNIMNSNAQRPIVWHTIDKNTMRELEQAFRATE